MTKKIISFFIVLLLLFILFLFLRDSIINNTRDNLNDAINNIYEYINKYNFDSNGVVSITAKYKGAHGSINPIDYSYSFSNEYDGNKLYTLLENEDGYYINELDNELIDIYMKLRNNEDIKKIFSIKEIKDEFNKVIFIFDVNYINKVLDTNYNDFRLVINSNLLYLGIKDYKLLLDNNEINISSDFKDVSFDDLRINKTDNGFNIKYKDSYRISYKNKNNMDKYDMSINDCAINIEMNDSINIRVNKEVNIYNGLEIKIDFKDVQFNKKKENNRNNIPLFKYFDNANIDMGGLIWEK